MANDIDTALLESMFYTDKATGLFYKHGLDWVEVAGHNLLMRAKPKQAGELASMLVLHQIPFKRYEDRYFSIDKHAMAEVANKFLGRPSKPETYKSGQRIGHPKVRHNEGLRDLFKNYLGVGTGAN